MVVALGLDRVVVWWNDVEVAGGGGRGCSSVVHGVPLSGGRGGCGDSGRVEVKAVVMLCNRWEEVRGQGCWSWGFGRGLVTAAAGGGGAPVVAKIRVRVWGNFGLCRCVVSCVTRTQGADGLDQCPACRIQRKCICTDLE